MKYIPFKEYEGGIGTRAILRTILNQNPRGMMLDEIRRRCKLMDIIDEGTSHVLIKDDDFAYLGEAIKNFPFTVASKGLMLCLDDILAADEPPAILMPKKNGKDKAPKAPAA